MDDPLPQWLLPAWSSFLKSNQRSQVDGIYEGLFDSDLMPLQRKCELRRMIKWLQSKVRPAIATLMEVGIDKGGTLFHWLHAFPSVSRVIAVEIRGTPISQLFEQAFPGVEFLWLPASSYAAETVESVRSFLGDSTIDFLFLDGDKSHFAKDFWLYRPMVGDTGVIAMHDVVDDGSPMQADYLRVSKYFLDRHVVVDHGDRDDLKAFELVRPGEALTNYQQWLKHWSYRSCGFGCVVAGSGPVTEPGR